MFSHFRKRCVRKVRTLSDKFTAGEFFPTNSPSIQDIVKQSPGRFSVAEARTRKRYVDYLGNLVENIKDSRFRYERVAIELRKTKHKFKLSKRVEILRRWDAHT